MSIANALVAKSVRCALQEIFKLGESKSVTKLPTSKYTVRYTIMNVNHLLSTSYVNGVTWRE